MKIDKTWYLLVAAALSAVVGAVIATNSRRRRVTAHPPERAPELKSWENEGGNLAPVPATSSPP
jgi:hypothetical protein